MNEPGLNDRVRLNEAYTKFASMVGSRHGPVNTPGREGRIVDMGNGFLVCVEWDTPDEEDVDLSTMTTRSGLRMRGFNRSDLTSSKLKVVGEWLILSWLEKI